LTSERGHAPLELPSVRPDSARLLDATPPLRRTPIAPAPWRPAPRSRPAKAGVARTAMLRRITFSLLVLAQAAAFGHVMVTKMLPYHGREPLELAILALSAVLFVWISLGFLTAVSGFILLFVARARYSITRSATPSGAMASDVRTAVVMPICNEHVPRVFAGLRATYESLAQTGDGPRFDFFILSDSSEPDTLVAERRAWHDLCAAVGGVGRIFYRWRPHHIKRKSGNSADS